MKIKRTILAAALAFSACTGPNDDMTAIFLQDASIHFHFSHPESTASADEKEKARDALVAAINGAKVSLRMWCYELDEPAVIEALSKAKERGVRVEITGSADVRYAEAEASGLSLSLRPKSGLAHAKVVLVDENMVFSGTGNFTTSDFFWNNNAFFSLGVSAETGRQIRAALDNEQTQSAPYLPFQGRMLVSPGDGRLIQARIVRSILEARHRIQFLMFSHTDPVITAALAYQAMRGVVVEGIYDDTGENGEFTTGSEAALLNEALGVLPSVIALEGNRSRMELRPGEFHGGHLHHKTLLIDERVVLTGSYNWSLSARDQNREAFFEFSDPAVVRLFGDEFFRVKGAATLMARPPAPARPTPRITVRSGAVCWEDAAAPARLAVFSGSGTFFRAEYFDGHDGGGPGCAPLASKSSASAGVQWGSSYGFAPASADSALLSWQFNLTSSSPAPPTNAAETAAWQPPCDERPCEPANIFRTHLPDGWIWIRSESERYTEAVFWTPEGFETRALSRTAPYFYRFLPFGRTVGDTIVFLKTVSGRYEAACTRTGTTLSGPPAMWLKTYAYATGRTLSCIEDES